MRVFCAHLKLHKCLHCLGVGVAERIGRDLCNALALLRVLGSAVAFQCWRGGPLVTDLPAQCAESALWARGARVPNAPPPWPALAKNAPVGLRTALCAQRHSQKEPREPVRVRHHIAGAPCAVTVRY